MNEKNMSKKRFFIYLKMNDKLDINGKRYIINQMKINLRTEEADIELLNDI